MTANQSLCPLERCQAHLTDQPINSSAYRLNLGGSAVMGAVCQFEGVVRRLMGSLDVMGIEYHAYESLAMKEATRLLHEAQLRHQLIAVTLVHRIGWVPVGEAAILVQVAAAHRREAFLAIGEIMDAVKERVPIWKKEFYSDGTYTWPGSSPEPDTASPPIDRGPTLFDR